MKAEERRRQHVFALLNELIASSTSSVDNLSKMQLNRLRELLEQVQAQSSFWRQRLGPVDPSTAGSVEELLKQLRITERTDLQRYGQHMRILLPQTKAADYSLFQTSGTTGEPRQIIRHTMTASRHSDSLTLLEWEWQQRDVTKKLVHFRVNQPDRDNIPPTTAMTYLGNATATAQRASTGRTPGELLNELEKLQPNYLFCNALMVRLMALEQLRSARNVRSIEQILTASDPVDTSTRLLVREAFNARVCDRYSSEEFGIIALQCPIDEHLHVISPRMIVEVIDDDGKACGPGEPGRVLITNLVEFAQPLIRYDIGDIATLGEGCTAGISWPIIESIEGRTRQVIPTSDGRNVLVTFIGSEFLSLTKLLDFQVIKYRDAIVMRAHVAGSLTWEEREIIKKDLRACFHENANVVIEEEFSELRLSSYKRTEFEVLNRHFFQEK